MITEAAVGKACTKCGQEKPFSEYHPMRRGRFGLNSWCKTCMSTQRAAWRVANREREKATNDAWRAANPERVRATRLRSTYGLTPQQVTDLGSACAICGSADDLVIDHDHSCCAGDRSCSRCVRGRLCRRCNLALGHLNDNPALLRAALTYLEA